MQADGQAPPLLCGQSKPAASPLQLCKRAIQVCQMWAEEVGSTTDKKHWAPCSCCCCMGCSKQNQMKTPSLGHGCMHTSYRRACSLATGVACTLVVGAHAHRLSKATTTDTPSCTCRRLRHAHQPQRPPRLSGAHTNVWQSHRDCRVCVGRSSSCPPAPPNGNPRSPYTLSPQNHTRPELSSQGCAISGQPAHPTIKGPA
jgi:hypothetical protein